MLLLFQVCFFIGLGLTVLSFLLGSLFDGMDADGLDFDIPGTDFSFPIRPTVILIFLTVFGGIGYLLSKSLALSILLSTLLAIAAGIIISGLVNQFIIKPLLRAQNTSAPEPEELIGIPAKVTETIAQNGYGEITYTVNGNTFTSPAKETEGNGIEKGTEVSVCWIEKYVFYVTPLQVGRFSDKKKN